MMREPVERAQLGPGQAGGDPDQRVVDRPPLGEVIGREHINVSVC